MKNIHKSKVINYEGILYGEEMHRIINELWDEAIQEHGGYALNLLSVAHTPVAPFDPDGGGTLLITLVLAPL
jgi:hypothetical protein